MFGEWPHKVQSANILGWVGYLTPPQKQNLIEIGGIGTIRLMPLRMDDGGLLARNRAEGKQLPHRDPCRDSSVIVQKAGVDWGDGVTLGGQVRFLRDAGLTVAAEHVHHARPLIVCVDELTAVASEQQEELIITPAALFDVPRGAHVESPDGDDIGDAFGHGAKYTFVKCVAGQDADLDLAGEWIEEYARLHRGNVVTNFDERRPQPRDAPLSYQRLLDRSFESSIIERYRGNISLEQVERLVRSGEVRTRQFLRRIFLCYRRQDSGGVVGRILSIELRE